MRENYPWHVASLVALMLGLATVAAASGVARDSSKGRPVAVSPGDLAGLVQIGDACPTFSWGAVAEAESYELVVYRFGEEGEAAEPTLHRKIHGSALGWTPSLDGCLEPGADYAWSVRAASKGDLSEWSPPRLFRVAAGPSRAEFEKAVEVVTRYLESQEGDGESRPAIGSGAAVGQEVASQPHQNAAPPGTVMEVDGNIDADSFSGGGSLLTDLDPASLSSGTADIDILGLAGAAADLNCMSCVGATEIADGSVGSAEIAHLAVTILDIAGNAVNSSKIVDESVTSADLQGNSVGSAELQNDAVQANHIADDAVRSFAIKADAVGSSEIATDAVGSDEIGADAVGSSEIAANAVGSSEIATGAVDTDEIAANAVRSSEIAASAVDSDKIAADAVDSSKIKDKGVTSLDIGTGAVVSEKIGAGAVTTAKIAANAVGFKKLKYERRVGASQSDYTGPVTKTLSCTTAEGVVFGGGVNRTGGCNDYRIIESYPKDQDTWEVGFVFGPLCTVANPLQYKLVVHCVKP